MTTLIQITSTVESAFWTMANQIGTFQTIGIVILALALLVAMTMPKRKN